MTVHVEHPLLLIEEAIAGFRTPNRFDEGEAAIFWHNTKVGARVCVPVVVREVARYYVRVELMTGCVGGWVPQYDVLKLAAVENSQAL